jgi:hypothetical protein
MPGTAPLGTRHAGQEPERPAPIPPPRLPAPTCRSPLWTRAASSRTHRLHRFTAAPEPELHPSEMITCGLNRSLARRPLYLGALLKREPRRREPSTATRSVCTVVTLEGAKAADHLRRRAYEARRDHCPHMPCHLRGGSGQILLAQGRAAVDRVGRRFEFCSRLATNRSSSADLVAAAATKEKPALVQGTEPGARGRLTVMRTAKTPIMVRLRRAESPRWSLGRSRLPLRGTRDRLYDVFLTQNAAQLAEKRSLASAADLCASFAARLQFASLPDRLA